MNQDLLGSDSVLITDTGWKSMLPIQLLDNVLGKAAKHGPGTWSPQHPGCGMTQPGPLHLFWE